MDIAQAAMKNIVSVANHAISESFLYDSLNRLSNQILTNTASAAVVRQTRYRYNAIGNILANSEVGNYSYASSRPHAITSLYGSAGKLSEPQYSYDLHGNIQSVSGTSVTGPTSSSPVNRTHTWTSFDNPLSFKLSEGAVQTDFLYGPEHQRIRETFSKTVAGVTTAKTLHILHPDNAGALYFEREAKTVSSATSTINTLENRHYLAAEKGSFLLITTNGAIQTNPTATSLTALSSPASSSETRYWHKDHLGSIVASTKQSSATSTAATGAALVIERLAYDPFGKRRFTNGNFDPTGSIDAQSTNRGFTGHEHLDELDFIHMNARVYDPDIGRFLSPDPTVAHPNNPQSFNRYAYAYNNPLNATDPTGFSVSPNAGATGKGATEGATVGNDKSTDTGNPLAGGTANGTNNPTPGQSTSPPSAPGTKPGDEVTAQASRAMMPGPIGGAPGKSMTPAQLDTLGLPPATPAPALPGKALADALKDGLKTVSPVVGAIVDLMTNQLNQQAKDQKNGTAGKGGAVTGDATPPASPNPAATEVTQSPSQAPEVGKPNSIHEQIAPDGKVASRTFYDSNGRSFARQDFNHVHAGKQPHEHQRSFDDQGRPTSKATTVDPKGYNNNPN